MARNKIINIGLLTYRNFITDDRYFVNIGDYIQTVACINLIRKVYNKKYGTNYNIMKFIDRIEANDLTNLNFILIPRDNISSVKSSKPVWVVMNGYFMISTNFGDVCNKQLQPIYDWNIPKNFNPLFTSFHLSEQIYPIVFQIDKINYLKKHEPIGCRDYSTINVLEKNGIKAYYSGCLTLTLDLFEYSGGENIYLVDADIEGVEAEKISHTFETIESSFDLYRKAVDFLYMYSRAKKVITSRLHALLPCVAMGVPVEFVPSNNSDSRFYGLRELQYDEVKLNKVRNGLMDSVMNFYEKII